MSSMENVTWITEYFKNTNELTQKTLDYEDKHVLLFYIKPLIDQQLLQKLLIKPLFEMASENQFKLYLQALPQFQEMTSKEQAQLEVMNGNVLVFIQNEFYLIDTKLSTNNQVNETSVETTIHGSQLALSDNLATNINICRKIIT